MSNQITGQVVHINQPTTNGNFTSQTAIVLTEPGQYQQYVEVQFSGNQLNLATTLQLNGVYTFSINIRGVKQPLPSTKTAGAYISYTSLSVWKVEPANMQQGAPQQAQPQQAFQQPQPVQQQAFPQQQQQQQQPAQFQQPQPASFVGQPAPQQAFPQAQQPAQQNPFQQPQVAQAQPQFGNPNANAQPQETPNFGGSQQAPFSSY